MSSIAEFLPSLNFNGWASDYLRKRFSSGGDASIASLCEAMMASDGEYSSLLLAQRVLQSYAGLDSAARLDFFRLLASDYDIDITALQEATKQYQAAPSVESLNQLTRKSEPRRQEFLRRLNMPDGVMPQLVKMREHLLELAKQTPEIAKIDADFRHLFRAWFNRGLLVMQPLDWNSPANVLEKIVSYEAVHVISDMEELRSRVAPRDRLCFAFFHPAMEGEPLVFLELALTETMSDSIEDILAPREHRVSPEQARCAIFYSISNCHQGLAGVSFGNLLIKQVVAQLSQQFPNINTFATLSPVPGFRGWLQRSEKTESALAESSDKELLKFAAEYLLEAKNQAGKPLDPVARFHLNNGAKLARLNLHADRSEKGVKQSLGLMVNYVYSLEHITENHERYVNDDTVVCDKSISKLLS